MNQVRSTKHSHKGQTLIEIIVTIGIVVLLLTGLLAGATGTLMAARYSKAKSLAVRYGQDAVELARSMRNNSWSDFLANGSINGKIWCLDKNATDDISTWVDGTNGCSNAKIDALFERAVTFTWHDNADPLQQKMTVDVTVSWQDGTKTYSTATTTYFTQWR